MSEPHVGEERTGTTPPARPRRLPSAGELDRYALVVLDLQEGFGDTAHWGPRSSPGMEGVVADLLAAWRARARPVVFVRHDSREEASPLRPDRPGNAFVDVVAGEPDLLVTKHVNSAFHGTPDLDAWLRARELPGIVVVGLTTNHCCETTARVGGNLGHHVLFVPDATATFPRRDPWGGTVSAEELIRTTAANLDGEFADVVESTQLLGRR